jgi:hypothetical protein
MSRIYKTHKRFVSVLGMITIAAFGMLSTLGTGGGGGDGTSGPQPLTYTGSTNPAAITLTNAPILVGNVLYGGISSTNIPIPAAASAAPSEAQAGNVAVVSKHLLAILQYSLDELSGAPIIGLGIPVAAQVPVDVDQTFYCEQGYYTLKGTAYVDDVTFDMTGTLAFNYVNCVNAGVTYNGSGNFIINWMNLFSPDIDATMSFVLMTLSSVDFSGGISGEMRLQASLVNNTETDILTMNYVAKDNNTAKMYKFEGLVMTMTIDDVFNANSSGSMTFSGLPARVYDSEYGYVVVATTSALLYSDVNLIYPDDGGVMTFTGENNSSITLTVLSGRHVMLLLDLDGDTINDETRYLLWEELAVNAGTDLTDTDSDGMHDSWETTYGLDPSVDDANDNPDGDGLTNLQEYQQGYDPGDPASP